MTAFILVLTACASGFERPVRDIAILFDSFEYAKVDSNAITFFVNGRLRNPNEFSIRPLRFTYQVSLDGRHFSNGLIDIRGIDEQIDLQLRQGKLEFDRQNAKLYYKSNSPFRFPVSIPFERLGGFAAAMKRTQLPYTINLVFTDERGKRAVLQHEGSVNLSAILKPVEFRDVEIHATENGSNITIGLFNDNDFELEVESCSYQLTTPTAGNTNIMIRSKKTLQARSWELVHSEDPLILPTGTNYRFTAGCRIGDSWFNNTLEGTVR